MFGELAKFLTTALVEFLGWPAAMLAATPLTLLSFAISFEKYSSKTEVYISFLARFEKIDPKKYLAICSNLIQRLFPDPIDSTLKFLTRSFFIYSILFGFAYFWIQYVKSDIGLDLKFPSRFSDIFEISLAFSAGYLIFLFCISQSILFLDLCKSARSSWQVLFALVADVLLTFASVAIFSGIIDASYSWYVYSHEKRHVSLEIQPLGELASEQLVGAAKPGDQELTSLLSDIDATNFSKKYPIVFSGILQEKSKARLQKEGYEFDSYFSFRGYERVSDKIVIGHRTSIDGSLEIPLSQAMARIVDKQNPCSPFLVQNLVLVLPSVENSGKVFAQANVEPNLKALNFGRMVRDAIGFQLQRKWQTIGSGFLQSDANTGLSYLINSSLFSKFCSTYPTKNTTLDQYRDDIFGQSYYNELDSNRSPFWSYGIPSAYYGFASFSTSILFIFVTLGLVTLNFYNVSSRISLWIFSKVLEDMAPRGKSYINSAVLGICVVAAFGLSKLLYVIAFG